MKRKTTFKDKLTNIAGLVILLAGSIGGLSGVVDLPDWTGKAAIIAGTLAGVVVAWLTGKGEDGKRKPIQHNPYK